MSGALSAPRTATSRPAASVQGASTLTMQLARNLFLSPDRSFHRKIQEILLAIQIERRFTKPQIFTLYCEPDFSGAWRLWLRSRLAVLLQQAGKKLTLDEAAVAGRPAEGAAVLFAHLHPDRAFKRRNLVINSMLEDGKITARRSTCCEERSRCS